jgi:hypothetical protein
METRLVTLHSESILDRRQESKVFDDGSVWSYANSAANQHRDVIVDPVLLTGTKWSIDVNLNTDSMQSRIDTFKLPRNE